LSGTTLASERLENKMSRAFGFMLLTALAMLQAPAWGLANPAAVFCVKNGGKSEIRNGPRGQYGVCRLPNGRVVEEWSYYRRMKGKSGRQ
jgi:putative hemolysin